MVKSKRFLYVIVLFFSVFCMPTSQANNTKKLEKALGKLKESMTELSKRLDKLAKKSDTGPLDEKALKALRHKIGENEDADFETMLKPLIQQYIDGQNKFDCAILFDELGAEEIGNKYLAAKMLFDSKKCDVNKSVVGDTEAQVSSYKHKSKFGKFAHPGLDVSGPPLLVAEYIEDYKLATMLLDQENIDISVEGVEVENFPTNTGRSVLTAAIFGGVSGRSNVELVKKILEVAKKKLGDKFTDFVNKPDKEGDGALSLAKAKTKLAEIKNLIEAAQKKDDGA